jgi:3-oxoacyl-(acyl-carrier-protein) synthase
MGADLLRRGEADAVVAGGYDVLCRFVLRGFDALRSLTRDAVRPFDRRRSGLLLGEAGALALLLRERDVTGPRLGTLLGYGSASDGFHIAAPQPEGRGLERAIAAALADAGVSARDIDLVSAHGTATPLNDRIETAALKRALGARAYQVPVNSIKAGLGHTMGAAAALEAFMCLLAAQRGLIPPTLNLEDPDPECDLDYVPGQARAGRPRLMLSTSMGFGGCNGALVLQAA